MDELEVRYHKPLIVVRCTVELDMVYGIHFFPDSDDNEVIQNSATEAFVNMLHEAIEGNNGWTLDRDSWVQTKIVEEKS